MKLSTTIRHSLSCLVTSLAAARGPSAACCLLQIRVNLWDLAGSPDYLEVRNEFYKDSQAALLVYDVTNRPSFEALSSWVAEAAKYGAPSSMVSIACS